MQVAAVDSAVRPTSTVTDQADRSWFWPHLERVLWLLAATCVLVYGNGHHDFVTVALYHPAIWKYAA